MTAPSTGAHPAAVIFFVLPLVDDAIVEAAKCSPGGLTASAGGGVGGDAIDAGSGVAGAVSAESAVYTAFVREQLDAAASAALAAEGVGPASLITPLTIAVLTLGILAGLQRPPGLLAVVSPASLQQVRPAAALVARAAAAREQPWGLV